MAELLFRSTSAFPLSPSIPQHTQKQVAAQCPQPQDVCNESSLQHNNISLFAPPLPFSKSFQIHRGENTKLPP